MDRGRRRPPIVDRPNDVVTASGLAERLASPAVGIAGVAEAGQ